MAKVTNVNIDCSTRQGSQVLFDLKTLLLANGWTITATSDGTNFTNGASPDNVSTVALFDVSNAYYVLADPSGTCWIYVQRRAANTTFTVKASRLAPQTNGTASALPTCATASNEITLVNDATLFNSSASARGHIITYDTAQNAAGVRPFYLLMTDGTSTLRGGFFVEAIADGTYDTANAYPWVVAAGAANAAYDYVNFPLKYYYSPTNVFTSANWAYNVQGSPTAVITTGIPSPWSGRDTALPIAIGRGATSPGAPVNVLGYLKNLTNTSFYRNYPNTMTTGAGERYVYAVYFVIPFANGVTPAGGASTNYPGYIVNDAVDVVPVAIYRGRVGGEYVYSLGSAPMGATDVVIVGYT